MSTAFRVAGTDLADMTPSERSMRARLAAYAMHAKHDARDTTEKARAAALNRFEHEVDPDGVLSPNERARRAEAARRAHMTRLALKSATVRRKRAARA